MSDKLSRPQLERITDGDRRAARILEDLLATVIDSDLTEVLTRLTAVETQSATTYGWGDHALAGYLTDAPSDGNQYVRKDAAWSILDVTIDMSFDDNEKLYFGDSDDAAIYYNGSDLYIDPKEVGTGQLKTNDGDVVAGPSGVFYSNMLCAI